MTDSDWRTRWQEKTRDGTPVRIYAEDGGVCHQRVHGATSIGGVWSLNTWNKFGEFTEHDHHRYDLMPVEKPKPLVLEWEGTPQEIYNQKFYFHIPNDVPRGKRFRIRAEEIL